MNNTPKTHDGLLDTATLANRLRVTPKAVRAWVKAGCPVATRKKSAHGRPGMRFNLKAVRLWLVSTGNVSRSMLAAPDAVTVTADQKGEIARELKPMFETQARERQLATLKHGDANPVKANLPERASGQSRDQAAAAVGVSGRTVQDAEFPTSAGSQFEAALNRARDSEQATFALWAKTLASDPLTAAAHHARWIAAADCLLRLEKAKDEILIGENTTIRTADAYAATASILQAVRIDVQALPNSIAPRLAGLSVPEIAAVLRQAVEDVLRHIHKGEK